MYYDDDPEQRFHQLTLDQKREELDLEKRIGNHRSINDWKTVGITAVVFFGVWLLCGSFFFEDTSKRRRVEGSDDSKPAYVSERDKKIRERKARERADWEAKQQEKDDAIDSGVDFLWRLIK
ncbi:MAG: hypothetical protein ACR2NP_15020 [Pirellulaceae bacterium]